MRGLRSLLVGAVVAWGCLLAGAAGAAGAGVSARDDLGQPVALKRPARRVVALAPNAAEILFAIGAGPTLVGAPAEANYPAAAARVPRVGSFSNPDEERLLALKPDLAVVAHGNPRELLERLRARGVPVFVCHPRKVADIPRAMRALGRLTGSSRTAEAAARSTEARLAGLSRRLRGRPPVACALLVWDDPITVAGAGAYLHDALQRAGGRNVAGDLPQPYPTLDPEQMAVRNPSAIIYAGHDPGGVGRAAARPGIRTTAAARSRRVFAVHDDLVLRPGPRLVAGIEAMARALHPEVFARRP